MHRTRSLLSRRLPILLMIIFLAESICAFGFSNSITVVDMRGRAVQLMETPKRVVSLVPSATDALFALGAGDLVAGLTLQDSCPRAMNEKAIVGSFFEPSPEVIEKLRPDMILLSSLHRSIEKRFGNSGIPLVYVDTLTMDEGFRMLELMGQISGRRDVAAALICRIRAQLDLVCRKVAKIPNEKRKRVMRVMGCDTIMTPGDESFQNEFIRCAGGIPPSLGKSVQAVPVTEKEWVKFDPQVVYYCGDDRSLAKEFFDKPDWKDVEALRKGHIECFPCSLTCRASVHMGDFVQWLAGVIYAEELIGEETKISPDRALKSRSLAINLPYVKAAQVIEGTLNDFPTQTLCIDFVEPMVCLNSLQGIVTGVTTAGNHYSSPPLWKRSDRVSMEDLKGEVCRVVGRDPSKSSFLYTGARMDSLAVGKTEYKDMKVFALVTAGVKGNAMRAGVDEGVSYDAGTINIVILTNMRFTARALTRAIICATEAKSAALQDLDIHSIYSPRYQATGTGTDEVMVVEGRGPTIECAGGHCKMGELISKAVYQAVKESISLQNGVVPSRSVFQRIADRKIDLRALVSQCGKFSHEESARIYRNLQRLLLDPVHAGFIESAFAIGAAHDAGLVCDLQSFLEMCRNECNRVAGHKIDTLISFTPESFASEPVRAALDALINGLSLQEGKSHYSSPGHENGVFLSPPMIRGIPHHHVVPSAGKQSQPLERLSN
ncbi:MAG: adenosylcobinamide amidohydrolase [Desulfomonilaceae bacterium]